MCRKMGKGHEDATGKSRFTKVYAKLFNLSSVTLFFKCPLEGFSFPGSFCYSAWVDLPEEERM